MSDTCECQKQPPEVLRNFRQFRKIHWKTSVTVSFLIKLQPMACNFIKKKTLAQVFSCEICEISKNTFFTEHRDCFWNVAFFPGCNDMNIKNNTLKWKIILKTRTLLFSNLSACSTVFEKFVTTRSGLKYWTCLKNRTSYLTVEKVGSALVICDWSLF